MKKQEKLKIIRKQAGITNKELAYNLGYCKEYLNDIENGRRLLSYKMAYKISKVLGLKPDDLFKKNEKE